MNLIDNYISEVGEYLPGKLKADLQAEIRSLIEDTLDERSQASNRPREDEGLVVEVLKEFGSPRKVAAAYLPQRYLIGPQLFPAFMLVLRIVLMIVIIVTVVTMSVSIVQNAHSIDDGIKIFTQSLVNFVTSALSIFGNIVFIFAIVEWLSPKVWKEKIETWDPLSLDLEEESERVKPMEMIWGIFFTVVAILVFNFYSHIIGMIYVTEDGTWMRFLNLSAEFYRYLPWLNLLWGLDIIFSIVIFRTGRWQPATRWLVAGLKLGFLVIMIVLATGAPLLEISSEFYNVNEALQGLTSLYPLINVGIRGFLGIFIVIGGIEFVQLVYKMVRNR
jgi:hypothetical protein